MLAQLLTVLVDQVHEMRVDGELKPDGLLCGVATVDGKNLPTLELHAGGASHCVENPAKPEFW